MIKTITLGTAAHGLDVRPTLELLALAARGSNVELKDRREVFEFGFELESPIGEKLREFGDVEMAMNSCTTGLTIAAVQAWIQAKESRSGTEYLLLTDFPRAVDEASMFTHLFQQRLRVIALVNGIDQRLPALRPLNGEVLLLEPSQPVLEKLHQAVGHVCDEEHVKYRWRSHLNDHKHAVRKRIRAKFNI